MIGKAPPQEWLQTDWILGQFSQQRELAQLVYIDFVRAGVGLPSIWDKLQSQIFLGSDDFISRLQSGLSSSKSLQEVPRVQRRPPAKSLSHYQTEFADNPHTGMALAYRSGDYSMKAVAEAFGVHYSTVSRAVKNYETYNKG